MPSAYIQLHLSGHRSGEGFSFPSSDVKGDRNVVQVCSVSILFPPLSPNICWVPRAKVTQLNQGSRGGSTKGGRCSASRSRFAPSLLKSLQEMRPAPSLGLTLRVLPWSLSSLLGRGSLVLGGESSSTGLWWWSGAPTPMISSSFRGWLLSQSQRNGWQELGLVLAVDREFSAPFDWMPGAPA